jgi:hypothetical protein
VPGLDRQAYRGPAHAFATQQNDLAKLFAQNGANRAKRRDVLSIRAILDIAKPIEESLWRAGIAPGRFASLGRYGLTDFLRRVPTRWTELQLLTEQHDNPTRTWKGNDLIDIVAFSIAIVYCDAVIGEKHWIEMARSARHCRLTPGGQPTS